MSNVHPNRALFPKELEARRRKAARYFQDGKTRYWVAKHFKVSFTASGEWYARWKEGTLGARKPGKKEKLSAEQKKKLSNMILKNPTKYGYDTQLWTLDRITSCVKKELKVSYKPRSLSHMLHTLGFSCQKPERRAKERNEKKIAEWKKVTWPALLKKGSARINLLFLRRIRFFRETAHTKNMG